MTRLFGTDGVRGVANRELTPELTFRIGRAGATILCESMGCQPTILVAQDGRLSGDMLESALIAGICSAGAHAAVAGLLPTPGAAYICRRDQYDAAVMISASHNSFEFNGIKIFNKDGYKLSDEVEDSIEALAMAAGDSLIQPVAAQIGRRLDRHNAAADYSAFLQNLFSLNLSGLKIGLDCANGAASQIAPQLFRSLGAEVFALATQPDGLNINAECGSLYPQRLGELVLKEHCDLGFAFDGDADRMIAVDDSGAVLNGDVVLGLIALDMKKQGLLARDTLVATVMSNQGLEKMTKEAGIRLLRTQVGDRYVLEEMLRGQYNFGGEQSGHLILLEHTTTGDGMLSALRLVKSLLTGNKSLSEAKKLVTILPQVLKKVNIENCDKNKILRHPVIEREITAVSEILADSGRVLVRPSGTEPIIRVMIEGEDQSQIDNLAQRLVEVIATCR